MSGIAWSANGINHPRCPKKSYMGWTKVAHHLSAGALIWWDHSHEMKMEIVTSSLLWIHSQSGWKSAPYPHCIVGGQLSSYMMTWLPVGASRTTSRPTMALSLWAALHDFAKGLASSITTSPLATVRPKAGRMDDQEAQGLYPAWPDQGARNLLDKLFSLGSTPVTYDGK